MAPHCDTMDGPVVTAAELALEMENVNYIIPFVKRDFEGELKDAFDRTIIVRELSGDAAEVADFWFFETAVRLHMLGEGKPYNGIKHSGLYLGPVIHKAEEAIDSGDKTELEEFLMDYNNYHPHDSLSDLSPVQFLKTKYQKKMSTFTL